MPPSFFKKLFLNITGNINVMLQICFYLHPLILKLLLLFSIITLLSPLILIFWVDMCKLHDVHCMFKMYEHHISFISHNIVIYLHMILCLWTHSFVLSVLILQNISRYIYEIINQRMFHLLLFLRIIAEYNNRICVKTKQNKHKN